MVWMDRAASRWLMVAAAYAAWCTGSVWVLLETTRPYPGIISMKPGRGAFELSEFVLHMPAWQVLACLFLLAFLAMAIIGGLRRFLDPDRLALNAVLWVARSRSLWLALAIATILALAGIWLPGGLWGGTEVGIQTFVFVAAILVPFAAWNAGTLQRDALSAWWRPRWPGWQAVLLVFGVMTISFVIQAAIFVVPKLIEPVRAFALLNVLDQIFSFLGWLLIAVAWIERATVASAWRSFLAILRWRRLRPLLWQWLLFAVVIGVVLVPVLMVAILVIYVVPQYAEWAKSGGTPITWFLRVLVELASRFGTLALLPAVVVLFQGSLAQGRLLVSLGASDSGEPRK
ncbi:MAG: hypothetical protein QM719_12295 [Thermomonas sp.]